MGKPITFIQGEASTLRNGKDFYCVFRIWGFRSLASCLRQLQRVSSVWRGRPAPSFRPQKGLVFSLQSHTITNSSADFLFLKQSLPGPLQDSQLLPVLNVKCSLPEADTDPPSSLESLIIPSEMLVPVFLIASPVL